MHLMSRGNNVKCCDTSCKSAIKMPSLLLLSSSDSRMLTKTTTNLKSSSKGFYSAAPDLWNGLPYVIRHAVSSHCLKTHLF